MSATSSNRVAATSSTEGSGTILSSTTMAHGKGDFPKGKSGMSRMSGDLLGSSWGIHCSSWTMTCPCCGHWFVVHANMEMSPVRGQGGKGKGGGDAGHEADDDDNEDVVSTPSTPPEAHAKAHAEPTPSPPSNTVTITGACGSITIPVPATAAMIAAAREAVQADQAPQQQPAAAAASSRPRAAGPAPQQQPAAAASSAAASDDDDVTEPGSPAVEFLAALEDGAEDATEPTLEAMSVIIITIIIVRRII